MLLPEGKKKKTKRKKKMAMAGQIVSGHKGGSDLSQVMKTPHHSHISTSTQSERNECGVEQAATASPRG